MDRRDIAKLLNKLDELELFLNDKVAGTKSGNPYHGKDGKFTTGPGGKKEPKISEDAQKVFDEEDWLTDGEYKKDLNAIFEEFNNLGVDLSKISFETNLNKVPLSMKYWIGNSKGIQGCACSKKNLEALIWLNEKNQLDYGFGGDKKYLEGKENKEQPFNTNNSAMGVIRHELGHIASYTLFMKGSGREASDDDIKVGAARLDIHNRFKKIFGDNYELTKLKLSRYGMKDTGEAVAESFSNPNFSEDTRKIYDYYKKELAKYAMNKNAVENGEEWAILCDGYKTSE